MSLRASVVAQFAEVAEQQGRTLKRSDDDAPLTETGLDSLCFAIIVARLEDQLGVDPFSQSEDPQFPLTVGEFVAAYERARS
ncbi:MAG: acyl carrier protein [Alphaproteobacteria bacterium]|nr:acyl carrier protein [Alphaproteobacteria bacterium]MBV9693887.1 acyl carrier protein [Alphaproteobacteria bacterium]